MYTRKSFGSMRRDATSNNNNNESANTSAAATDRSQEQHGIHVINQHNNYYCKQTHSQTAQLILNDSIHVLSTDCR